MLLPDYIDISESEKYDLSIRLDKKSLSFTLHDTESKAFCFVNRNFFEEISLLENVKQSIFDMSFLTQKYAATNLVYVSPSFEFIPEYIFEKQHQDTLFKLSHTDSKDKTLISEALLKSTVTVFDLEPELYNFLQRSMLNIKYHHHTHILANLFHKKTKIPSLNNQGFVNFDKDRCDVFFFRNQKLIHACCYENLKTHDLAFHILSVWEKAGYKQHDDTLFIYGESSIKDEVSDILKDYIQKIEEVGIPSDAELLGVDGKQTPLELLALSL